MLVELSIQKKDYELRLADLELLVLLGPRFLTVSPSNRNTLVFNVFALET